MKPHDLTTDANLARDVVTDVHLLVVQEHAVDSFDGGIGSFGSLIMNETIALRATLLVSGNLARQDVAEGSKRVMKSLE
jgi:hypothetical protein